MLDKYKHIFFIGIKGVAMSNLALIFKKMGKKVGGVDVSELFITDKLLRDESISYDDFSSAQLDKTVDLVVYSAAHGGIQNPLVRQAQEKGITVMSQAVLIGELIGLFSKSIGVAGCHGKTTTSSLLSYALIQLGVSPSYLVGVPYFNHFPGGDYQKKDYFVFEADEYGINPPLDKTPKLKLFNPTYAICTNIDYDHPDVYKDINETKQVFLEFLQGRNTFLCADDPNLESIFPLLDDNKYETFGYDVDANLQITSLTEKKDKSVFTLSYKGTALGTFSIKLFGEKNISNTAGVVLMLLKLGFQADQIKKAIGDFSQVKRRCELVYSVGHTFLFDDYGHHPVEIEATIAALRRRFPKQRIIMLFQPHTYSRTESLKREFVHALKQADQALIAPIFASAREKSESFAIRSKDLELLAKEAKIHHIKAFASKDELMEELARSLKENDVVCTCGAGDIYKLKDDIILTIKSKCQNPKQTKRVNQKKNLSQI